jgi:hypothetical protein
MTIRPLFKVLLGGLRNTLREKSTPAWIRTKDQLIKSQLLYQLSYRGF